MWWLKVKYRLLFWFWGGIARLEWRLQTGQGLWGPGLTIGPGVGSRMTFPDPRIDNGKLVATVNEKYYGVKGLSTHQLTVLLNLIRSKFYLPPQISGELLIAAIRSEKVTAHLLRICEADPAIKLVEHIPSGSAMATGRWLSLETGGLQLELAESFNRNGWTLTVTRPTEASLARDLEQVLALLPVSLEPN